MISKQRLIDTLLVLKQQVELGNILKPNYGICKNWKEILNNDFSYDLVAHLSVDWWHRTDYYSYPVPDDESYGLWESVNLEMRLSLIDHIIKRLEESSQEDIDGWYRNL